MSWKASRSKNPERDEAEIVETPAPQMLATIRHFDIYLHRLSLSLVLMSSRALRSAVSRNSKLVYCDLLRFMIII